MPDPGRGDPVADVVSAVFGILWVRAVVVAGGLIVAALVATAVVLPLVILLSLIALILATLLARLPWIGPKVRPALIALVATVVDAAVWTSRPVRAAVMRDVVRAKVREAATESDRVILVGHSQGAAVCYEALFAPDDPNAVVVDCLVTVGAGISSLGRPGFSTRQAAGFTPVRTWSAHAGTRRINVWGTWDPVSAGPFVDDRAPLSQRWRVLYASGIAAERTTRLGDKRVAEVRRRGYEALTAPEQRKQHRTIGSAPGLVDTRG